MGGINIAEWRRLPMSLSELCINTTLRCGQSFRWRKSDSGVWSMALHGRIISLHQDPTHLYYRSHYPSAPTAPLTPPSSVASESLDNAKDDTLSLLQHYLNLTPNLTSLYAEWSSADVNFAARAPKFTGIRILRQDAWEALVGFICSSNNNIARISQMVDKLCRYYGPYVGTVEGEKYFDFPGAEALSGDGVEARLRELGFGYRARYLAETARMILEKEDGWLDGLRNPEAPVLGTKVRDAGEWKAEGRDGYRTAHEGLLELQGVGPKVADCVCLMGLGWGEAVPVDTHVWQIAQRDYKFGKGKHSSLTKATYDAVGNKFRSLWGKEAGWAHSVLFTADLRAFAERLVVKKETREEQVIPIKKEEGQEEEFEIKTEETKVLVKKVKREHETGEATVTEIQSTTRRSKRAKR
ncbi:putative DNA N-glycosylase [Elsinoe ampelina]|uniref:DNA-(apurinic or apyrimidinic site) lyase n=1 Tax=Elsinoe ampelina TaxID=302913 RepID=A0A6A6GHM0_9PEZI|nr:putative DNA N-glycosylase [Elsinoe ampelina]